MIGWLFDRIWAHKNRAALDTLDQEADALQVISDRLNVRMEAMYGPDWRQQGEERLKRAMVGRWSSS